MEEREWEGNTEREKCIKCAVQFVEKLARIKGEEGGGKRGRGRVRKRNFIKQSTNAKYD